jgi:putative aminopeptidase FrvX
MKKNLTSELAGRLMRHPAVAYHEHAVRDEVESILREHSIPFTRDSFGNVIARLATAPKLRPIVLAAHMDHPGFEVLRTLGPGRWQARFRGSVPPHYFRAGLRVRLMPDDLQAVLQPSGGKTPLEFELHARGKSALSVTPQAFAVWDLEDFALRDGLIVGRACDDLVGVASALSALIELKRTRARVHVLSAFTRAEEIGFQGALAIAETQGLPRKALVISLETSRELPGVRMGEGVIIRTGDKASVFNSDATRFLTEVAAKLQARVPAFKYQRALMSGGTCEATAYQEYGYQSTAVCVALGNYHNCGKHNRIRAEFVNVEDAAGMSALLVATALNISQFPTLVGKLTTRLAGLAREARRNLPGTAVTP